MSAEKKTDITTLHAVFDVYRAALSEIKRWEKVRDDCNATLKSAVGEGVGLVNGVPAINVTRVVSRRFDAKLFRDEFPELAEKYETESVSVRLTLVDNASSD